MIKQTLLKALVVDDNPFWLRMLSRLVSGSNYAVFTAKTYDAALRVAREERPDLVVTDIRFRDDDEFNMDGLRLLQKLQELGQLKRSIVVTGYSDPIKRDAANRVGALYFEKGNFTREDFQNELERIGDIITGNEAQQFPSNPVVLVAQKSPKLRSQFLAFLNIAPAVS